MTAWHIEAGSRVETTGLGRTSRWKQWVGTVTGVTDHLNGNGSIQRTFDIAFDKAGVTATLTEEEIRLQTLRGCPCARCFKDHPGA